MFGKKLFGLLGLLYIGSQISSVSAGGCTATYSEGGLKINSDCDVGYYLINNGGNDAPSDLSIECTGGATCSLVYCSENNNATPCVAQGSFTGLVTYGLDPTTILECSDGQCKVVTLGSQCSSASAGGIVTGGLCITATDSSEVGFSYAVEGETYYYITVASGSTTSFTGPNPVEGNTKVLVKIGNGAAQLIKRFEDDQIVYLANDGDKKVAIHDNGVNGIVPKTDLVKKYEYCLTKNSVIMERMENHCSDETCEDYYTCDENAECRVVIGTCPTECNLEESEAVGCVAGGYYLKGKISTKLASDDQEAGILYYCSTATSCSPATGVKIGYYKNADDVNAEAPQYILCSNAGSNSCTAVKVTNTACDEGGAKIGDLVVNESNDNSIEICLATGEARGIGMNSGSTAISYFISVASAGNKVFGNKEGNYVKINLANNNILLNDKEGSADRYVYTTDKHLIQVQKRSSAVCGSGKAIVEFKVNLCEDDVEPGSDPVNYYKISESKTWGSV